MLRASLLVLAALAADAQTTIDLSSQARRVDFTAADWTRPVKAGTTLPTTCTVGDLYFKTDATAGQNLYVCAAANTWNQTSSTAFSNGGTLVASRPALNLVAGTGLVTVMTDMGTKVDTQLALDTAVLLTPYTHQAGTPLLCASGTASATAYGCSLTPMLQVYTAGMILNWRPDIANTGAATLNVDSLGAVSIKKWDGSTDPAAGDIVAGAMYPVWYDGTVFRLTMDPAAGTSASAVTAGTLASARLTDAMRTKSYSIAIGGTGSAITAPENKGYAVVDGACTITGWALAADAAGSISVEIDRSNDAIPAATTGTITASANPSLSAAQYRRGTCPDDCSGWTTSLAANDVLGFYVTSASTVTRVTATLFCRR